MMDKSGFPLSVPVFGAGGKTGTWRTARPVIDRDKCTGCLLCWVFCPEGIITKNERKVDYEYCKGCGVCAKECPVSAIEMVRED